MKKLMEKKVFTSPKPTKLLHLLLTLGNTNKEAIILDFFSGSATTAHAVMRLNSEDGGNRKFIMVQLPEKTDEKSEAFKAGYKNICEIGRERIRRAGKKIKEESPLTSQDLDTGFRVLKLDSTNMQDIYYSPKDISQARVAPSSSITWKSRSSLVLSGFTLSTCEKRSACEISFGE